MKKLLNAVWNYMLFFTLFGLIITCNVVLFLELLRRDTGIVYTEDNVKFAALFTFWNTVFLSLVCTVIDKIRRKLFVEKPVNKILEVTNRITHGDYSARVKSLKFGIFNKIGTDLNIMAEELSSTEIFRNDFISNVSHELKTPLAVLQNYGSLLEEPNLSEKKRLEYAKSISRVTKHLSKLITNILKLSKLESQKIFPNLKNINLSEMLCECLIGFESEWDNKNIEINADIEDDVYISTDPEMLILVWTNLLSNALKFTPAGGRISVILKNEGGKVSVSIADTGCGMNEKTMKHIFNKFYQGDTSHSENGNGLGLALVKRVIDILKGEISVESTPGSGSVFTVRL